MKDLVFGLYSLDYTLVKNIDRIGFSWRARFLKIFVKNGNYFASVSMKSLFFLKGAKSVSFKRSPQSAFKREVSKLNFNKLVYFC